MDEILNLIESVSEVFSSYSFIQNELDHVTKQATMPIYGNNIEKIFSRTTCNGLMAMELVSEYC